MTLRALLVSLRDQHETDRRLEQEKSDRRAAWIAAYEEVVSAFSIALEPLVSEGLLTLREARQELIHPAWGDYQASILTFEAPGKRAELRPVNEVYPGYAGQALLVRLQEGKSARGVTLYLFASESGPRRWQLRLSDLQGIFAPDVATRPDVVFAPMDVALIHATLEKVLTN